MYTEEQVRKAIELARILESHDGPFEVEGIMGLTEVCTHDMDVKYSSDQIIKAIQE
jgi:hypothetical protein